MSYLKLPPMRPYQIECVDQTLDHGHQLIALTMGAGKTRAAIEAVKRWRWEGGGEGGLCCGTIFCSKSLMYQWREEIHKWDPGASVNLIEGTPKQRESRYLVQEYCDYTILTYDALNNQTDWPLIQEHLPIDFIIADEVTMVKSFRAKRSKRLKEIAQYAGMRLGLTGQPVENRPEELFSIMEFVDPDVLGNFFRFDQTFIVRNYFGRPERFRNLDRLHERLRPVMYRKSRADIAQFLPKKVETEFAVKMYPKAAKLANTISEDILNIMEDMQVAEFDLESHYGRSDRRVDNRQKGAIMSRVTCLRLLSNHPELLRGSADRAEDPDDSTGSEYALSLREAGFLDALTTEGSAKLDALMEMVDELEEEGDYKLVVFSGFKDMLRIIGDKLRERGILFTLMTGDTTAAERHLKMQRFREKPAVKVFLSSDAGSYGINLDTGTHLVNYDLPWSAGQYSQRIARIDRTSSEQESIAVVSMFSAGTVEEFQHAVLTEKAKVAAAFVDNLGATDGKLEFDLSTLKEFLLTNEA